MQIYSQGYMHGDPGYWRYFAYMSLFTTSMLGLVLFDSILLIYMFWELVGLSSYLLIGFWFHRPAAAAAAKKAFLVTRLGDLGFLLAILLIYTKAGTFNIPAIQEAAVAGALERVRADLVRPRRLRRRGRQVGPVPAARLAAGRHGGPDAGQRPDPRRDDGRGRRLPGRAHVPAVQRLARRHARRRRHRRLHGDLRRRCSAW